MTDFGNPFDWKEFHRDVDVFFDWARSMLEQQAGVDWHARPRPVLTVKNGDQPGEGWTARLVVNAPPTMDVSALGDDPVKALEALIVAVKEAQQ